MRRLRSRGTALVTGGGTGLGAVIARHFAEAGVAVEVHTLARSVKRNTSITGQWIVVHAGSSL